MRTDQGVLRRAATAATLGKNGTDVKTEADAAKALEPIVGPAAKFLFAAGFIGSGILAVPVLAASGSAGAGQPARQGVGL